MMWILWHLTQNLLVVAMLSPLVWVACRWWRDRPAVQHVLWTILLIKLILPPVFQTPGPQPRTWLNPFASPGTIPTPPGPPVTANGPNHRIADPTVLDQTTDRRRLSRADHPADASGTAQRSRPSRSGAHGPDPGDQTSITHGGLDRINLTVAAIWITGGVITLLRQLRRLARHWCIVRRATPAPPELHQQLQLVAQRMRTRPVPLAVVAGISSPLVWCVGRVQMLWPRRLAAGTVDQRFRAVMAHELAHIRRRDHWIAWLELVAGLVWWWNPLFWWIRHQLRDAAEMACDAEALRIWPADRHSYAETFLELSLNSRNGAPVPVLGVSTGAHQSFRRRLSMMLSDRVSSKITAAGFLAATVLTLSALPTWSWGQNPSGREQAERRAAVEAQRRAVETYQQAIAEAAKEPKGNQREGSVPEPSQGKSELDRLNQRLQALEQSLDKIARVTEMTQQQVAKERGNLQLENDRRLRRLEAVLSRLDRQLNVGDEPGEGSEVAGDEAEEDADDDHQPEAADGANEEAAREVFSRHDVPGEAEVAKRYAAVETLRDDRRALELRREDLAGHLQTLADAVLQHTEKGEIQEAAGEEFQVEIRQSLAEAKQELDSAAREMADHLHDEFKSPLSETQQRQIESLAAEAASQAQEVAREAQAAAREAIEEAHQTAAQIIDQAQKLALRAAEQSEKSRHTPLNLKWHNQQGVLTLTDEPSGRVIARLKVSGDQRIELDGTRLRVAGPDGQEMWLELSAEPAQTDSGSPGAHPPVPPVPPAAPPAPTPPVAR